MGRECIGGEHTILYQGSLLGDKALSETAEAKAQEEATELPAAMHPANDRPIKSAKSEAEQKPEASEKAYQTKDQGSGKAAEKTTQKASEKTGAKIAEGNQQTHCEIAEKPGKCELCLCAV